VAFKPGYSAYVGLDSVAGAITNIQPYIDNTDLPQPVEQLEVSTLGTVSKQFIPGLIDGAQFSISGPYDVTLYSQLTGLKAAQAAGSSTASIIYGPGGSVAGQARVNAECYIASVGLSAGVGGRAEISATLQITGAVTNTTF
jgi:hypothetical protein